MKQLLLLHGALGAESQFSELKKALSESYEVHSFNFEGHGGRDSNQAFSMALFVQNVLDYCREKQIVSCSIFGYSMGGYAALKLAADYPGLVSELVTLGTKMDWSPEIAEKEVIMLNPEKIEAKIPHFAASLAALHAPLDWKEVMNKTAQMMLNLGNKPLLNPDVLSKIQIPVSLLLGSLDNMVTPQETQHVQQLLPQANFHQIEGWQHPIDRIDSKELAEILLKSFS